MTSPSEVIRILSVDDHPLIRAGVAALVGTQPDMTIVGEAKSGREAIESYRATRPDILLIDIQMPDMDGIDAIIAIRYEVLVGTEPVRGPCGGIDPHRLDRQGVALHTIRHGRLKTAGKVYLKSARHGAGRLECPKQ